MAKSPERVGPYQVVRELGRGGMGVVFEVTHPELGGPFALKLMFGVQGDAALNEALARFTREAQLMARVKHPGVVKIHTLDRAPEGPYLVSELVPGEALSSMCKRGALDPREAARLVRELADAVAALHAAGILHRDLKPHNVIVKPDGAPMLLDFGIARDLESRDHLTRTGAIMGTPAYMAPEQADGMRPSELDGRVDVYALGAILFEAMSGRPPFDDTTSAAGLLKRVMLDDPLWPSLHRPDVPRELEAILKVAMRKNRGARYPSAAALKNDLDAWLRGERPWAASAAPASPLKWLVPLALILAGATAAGVLFALRRPPPVEPPPVATEPVVKRPPRPVYSSTTEPVARRVPQRAPWMLEPRLNEHELRGGVAVIDTAAGGDGRDVFAFQTTKTTELVRFRLDPTSDPAAEIPDGTPVELPRGEDVRAAVALPGRQLLVALQGEQGFRLVTLDPESNQLRTYRTDFTGEILVLARSPDGTRVAIGGDQQVTLLDAATGKVLAKAPAGRAGLYFGVLELAFSRDGRRLAAASVGESELKSEGHVRVWSIMPSSTLQPAFDSSPDDLVSGALSITFGHDGSVLVGLTAGRIDRFLPDGTHQTPSFKRLEAARLHDEIAQGGLTDTSGYAHGSDVWGLVVLDDGSLVSVSGGGNKEDPTDEAWNEIRRWRIVGDEAQELHVFPSAERSPSGPRGYADVDVSSAGFLFAPTWNGAVEVWPLER